MIIEGKVIEPPVDSQTLSQAISQSGVTKGGDSFFAKIKNFFTNLF